MIIDERFAHHFRHLQQVFLYVTDTCNLRCRHCLYKPNLTRQLQSREIPPATAYSLLEVFKAMGASKLTIMGGEPTMYGGDHQGLGALIGRAKSAGYDYVRIDTNGVFPSKLLTDEGIRLLDEITFSLDGPCAEINDPLRGEGSFSSCVESIRLAVKLGYRVDVTCCVHRWNIGRGDDGQLILDTMIRFLTGLGVSRVNFHPLFKMGIPRDTWTEATDVSPDQWVSVRREIADLVAHDMYGIPIRIPQRFVARAEFGSGPEYYGYCSAKLGERVLVHPDGTIRICALLIGTRFGVARFDSDQITWMPSPLNELSRHNMNCSTPCGNQPRDFGELVPLCISFKANQDEVIWREKLHWEDHRTSGAHSVH